MTKKLDPEIKALRALDRAWQLVPADARQRALEWFTASRLGRPGTELPSIPVRAAGEGDT